jgi:eukaryotic-like serine/threonine-protein kinase
MSMERCMQQGRVLRGRYRIEGRLGSGAMGTVFRAVDLRRGAKVAIKVVPRLSPSSEDYQRFCNEARIAAHLRHPNVVDVHEFNLTEKGIPFLVMELLEGEDLFDHLQRVRTLPPAQALPLLRQVGSALHAAHGIGIVHRDIKPTNIFLCREGDGEVVKVIDFGLSKLADLDALQTAEGILLGTLEYLAPEATYGRTGDIGPLADQWALGVVAYRMLGGCLPFQGGNVGEIISKVRRAEPVPLAQRAPTLPAPLCAAVARAMSLRKEDRFESVQAFLRALEDGARAPARAPRRTPPPLPPSPPSLHDVPTVRLSRRADRATPPPIPTR